MIIIIMLSACRHVEIVSQKLNFCRANITLVKSISKTIKNRMYFSIYLEHFLKLKPQLHIHL